MNWNLTYTQKHGEDDYMKIVQVKDCWSNIMNVFLRSGWTWIFEASSAKVQIFGHVINPCPCVDGVEGYCNRFVCLLVSLFVCLSVGKIPANIGTLKTLPADVKLYKDQK